MVAVTTILARVRDDHPRPLARFAEERGEWVALRVEALETAAILLDEMTALVTLHLVGPSEPLAYRASFLGGALAQALPPLAAVAFAGLLDRTPRHGTEVPRLVATAAISRATWDLAKPHAVSPEDRGSWALLAIKRRAGRIIGRRLLAQLAATSWKVRTALVAERDAVLRESITSPRPMRANPPLARPMLMD